jgi:WD40 repeat protein
MLALTLAALTAGAASPPSSSPWLPLFSFAAHQSGVNSLVATVPPPGGADDGTRRLLLFSGGDDEAVCAMGGSVECGAVGAAASSLRDCWSTSLPHAHQSAVRALALHWPPAVAASGAMVDPSSSPSALLFSAGYDQLIRVWRVDQEADGESRSGPAVCLRAVSAAPADVWDAAALTLVPQGRPQSQPPIQRHSCHWSPLLALGGQGLQLVQLQLPVSQE